MSRNHSVLVQFAYERVFEDRLRGESIRFIGMMLPEYLAHERVLGDHPRGEYRAHRCVRKPGYLLLCKVDMATVRTILRVESS